MLELVERHPLAQVSPDARSLRTWIERVTVALGSEPSE
jgi:hypothetical protein